MAEFTLRDACISLTYKLPIGCMVVLFCGSYLGSFKVIPKQNHNGAHGYRRNPSQDFKSAFLADSAFEVYR